MKSNPCRPVITCTACCCCSAKDVFRTACCRGICVKARRPTWNRRFEISVDIVRNISFRIEPDYRTVRRIIDHDIPMFLPHIPRGIRIQRGDHLEPNTSLPAYEWVYHSDEGKPFIDSSNTINPNMMTKKIILYFHGGAFSFGTRGSHRMLLCHMAKHTKAAILSIEYRRTPEVTYPVPDMDCFDAYKWLISQFPPSNIFISGDSAGGALAVSTMIRARDSKLPLPRAALLLSPWVDVFNISHPSMEANQGYDFLPISAIQYFASLYGQPPKDCISVKYQSLKDLPPLLIELGGCEVLRDQILEFVKLAQGSGVSVEYHEYPDMVHVFQLLMFTELVAIQQSFQNMHEFVDRMSNECCDLEAGKNGALGSASDQTLSKETEDNLNHNDHHNDRTNSLLRSIHSDSSAIPTQSSITIVQAPASIIQIEIPDSQEEPSLF